MKAKIGIYDINMNSRGGGEKLALVLAEHLSRDNDILVFVNKPIEVDFLENYFNVDLSRIQILALGKRSALIDIISSVPAIRNLFALATKYKHFHQIRTRNLDLFVNISFANGLVCPATRGIYLCMFPHSLSRSEGGWRGLYHSFWAFIDEQVLGYSKEQSVDSYSTIATISSFAGDWIQRLWGRSAEVIYPPCDDMGPPAPKERLILNVGRFQGNRGSFLKRQEVLLRAFKEMPRIHRQGWQLHFAGGVEDDEESLVSAERLVAEATGYPVIFHFGPDFSKLRELYRRASLYWHATGYGYPASSCPVKQEHFGITTVEAMSAGAVPIVINSGGQSEIVSHERNGLLWEDLSGLIGQTVRVIDDRPLLRRLSQQAVLSSVKFNRPSFVANMDRIIQSMQDGRGERSSVSLPSEQSENIAPLAS